MMMMMMMMMVQIQKISLCISTSILSCLLLYKGMMVQAGCTDVAQMCIWDTDLKLVPICRSFLAGRTYNVCRRPPPPPLSSGTTTTANTRYNNIAFELKVFTTFGGFNPCFEDGILCPEIQSVIIQTCRMTNRSSTCIRKNETTWRYFSYGNRVQLKNDTSGIGVITGRPYTAGSYNITSQVFQGDGACTTDSLRTSYLQLRDSCQGNEQYVLV